MDNNQRLKDIGEGFSRANIIFDLKPAWEKIKGLFEGGGKGSHKTLADTISKDRKMILDPPPENTNNAFRQFMYDGSGLENLDRQGLIDVYSQVRDYTGQDKYQMIHDLMTYRNRYYSR